MKKRTPPILHGEQTTLRLPGEESAAAVLDYFVRNEPHHAFTSPLRAKDFYTEGFWRQRLVDNRREFEDDVSMRLFVFHRDASDGRVIGDCGFTQFVRGPMQACFVGYALDHECEGQGLMYDALRAALPYAFEKLGFHRIMAGYLPTNERSGNLLRRLGFTVEGYARDYLYIQGAWRDHVLTALTNPNPQPPPKP